jgi:hypothetical protein
MLHKFCVTRNATSGCPCSKEAYAKSPNGLAVLQITMRRRIKNISFVGVLVNTFSHHLTVTVYWTETKTLYNRYTVSVTHLIVFNNICVCQTWGPAERVWDWRGKGGGRPWRLKRREPRGGKNWCPTSFCPFDISAEQNLEQAAA